MAKAPKKPRKKATNGYKMPDPLPLGEILTDTTKHSWRLGRSIGKGGFGEIYEAQELYNAGSKYPFVIKIEPHGNGPLFVEMHFYIKNAKQDDIDEFKRKNKLKTLGMPAYIASGSHETGNAKYRFIVMEKFGTDIDKLRVEHKGSLPATTVFQIAWQITYILEYIHEMGYVHADIKGANVLLGATPQSQNQAYLLDFGLATKYTSDKEFKPNPKKAHDGTIEYLSRDAHHGVPTRRGDFEILAYNIIHWLGGSLPWDFKTDDPKRVQQMKEESLSDIPKFLLTCLKKNNDVLHNLLDYVNNLKFNAKPDYKKIRQWFEQEVKKNGSTVNAPLELHGAKKRKSVGGGDVKETSPEAVKKVPRRKKEAQKETTDNVPEEVMTDAMKEMLAKKTARAAQAKRPKTKANGTRNSPLKEVANLQKEKREEKTVNRKKITPKINATSGQDDEDDEFVGYNAEMIAVQTKVNAAKKKAAVTSPLRRSARNVPAVCYSEKTPDKKK